MKTILVIAWADKTGIRNTGRLERFDGYNFRNEIERCWEGKALVYSSDMADKSRAAEHLNTMTEYPIRRLFSLPDSEDVLKIARTRILEQAEKQDE